MPDSLRLPRKLTCPTSTCDGFLAPAMQHEVQCPKTYTRKTMPSKLRFPRRKLCASLRSRNQHRISWHSCADETKPAPPSERLNERPAFTLTVRTPQCDTLFGEKWNRQVKRKRRLKDRFAESRVFNRKAKRKQRFQKMSQISMDK